MIYLRALVLYVADRLAAWADGEESLTYAGCVTLLRLLDEANAKEAA